MSFENYPGYSSESRPRPAIRGGLQPAVHRGSQRRRLPVRLLCAGRVPAWHLNEVDFEEIDRRQGDETIDFYRPSKEIDGRVPVLQILPVPGRMPKAPALQQGAGREKNVLLCRLQNVFRPLRRAYGACGKQPEIGDRYHAKKRPKKGGGREAWGQSYVFTKKSRYTIMILQNVWYV
jgi:hypothetical protein